LKANKNFAVYAAGIITISFGSFAILNAKTFYRMRLLTLFLVLAAVVLITFFIWGDSFMTIFSERGAIQWLTNYGAWAWATGIVLLISDLFLPLPATLIMSAIGYIYGTVVGGLINTAGSFLAGALGYWLCRLVGGKVARRILGEKDFERGKNLSDKEVGIWVIVLSRWLPVFPEVISCMAGLTRMSAARFHTALLCGSAPMAFTYAYIGHTGVAYPTLAIALSAGLPPVIWFTIRTIFRTQLKLK
jgi:uncharacterized membrane protein YdjX (TVP38/TMEM64 family)